MADFNRRNEFAIQYRPGRFMPLSYSEARARFKRGEDVYEKVLPDRSYTPREKARIPWTLVKLVDDQ